MIGQQNKIMRINTKEQRADIFTKGLTRFTFEQVRKLVSGWYRPQIGVFDREEVSDQVILVS